MPAPLGRSGAGESSGRWRGIWRTDRDGHHRAQRAAAGPSGLALSTLGMEHRNKRLGRRVVISGFWYLCMEPGSLHGSMGEEASERAREPQPTWSEISSCRLVNSAAPRTACLQPSMLIQITLLWSDWCGLLLEYLSSVPSGFGRPVDERFGATGLGQCLVRGCLCW